MNYVRTAARAMLAGIFVIQGLEGLKNPDRLMPLAKTVTDRLSPALRHIHPNLPSEPRTLVQFDQATKAIGGALLVTRLRRPAALLMVCSLVPTTLAAHRFWGVDDPAHRRQQRIQFLKNLGIAGGLILAAVDTEGRPGVRWRTAHALSNTRRSLRRGARDTRAKVRSAAPTNPVSRRLAR